MLLSPQLVSCKSIHILHVASNIVTPSLCAYTFWTTHTGPRSLLGPYL